jgi:PAS domain S-box-containing protein
MQDPGQRRSDDAGKATILLVDDMPANLLALEAILKDPAFQLVSVTSGAAALKAAREHEFAVMLLDVMMPGMDGFELATQLKRDGRNRHAPIIFLTALTSDFRQINKGYQAGGVDYLTKPLVPEQVKAKVLIFVELWQHKREIERLSSQLERRVEERTRELQQSEERFRMMIEEVRDFAIFTLNPDGNVATWNKGAEMFTGYTTEEIVGRPFAVFFPQEDADDAGRELEEAAVKGRADDERWHVKKGGERFWALGVTTAVRDDDGVLCGFTKVMRDFTEKQRAAERLEESEARLRLAMDATNLGTWDFNPVTSVCRWSSRCKEIFGLPLHVDIDQDAFLHALDPVDRTTVVKAIDEALAGIKDGKYDVEYRIARPAGGRQRWVRSMGQAFFDENGRAVRFIGTMLDISEQKYAEETLRRSETNFRLLAETMPQIVWTALPDGAIDYFNREHYAFLDVRGGLMAPRV